MTGDRGVGIALNVDSPFPAGSVGVSSTDVLGLEALEFLLVAEFVGHCDRGSSRRNLLVMVPRL